MNKLNVEYLRLILSFTVFIFITTLLFIYINQIELNWFNSIKNIFLIPAIVLTIAIPIWMIVDLIKKNVADKAIFNLTFFVSAISILLMLFAVRVLN